MSEAVPATAQGRLADTIDRIERAYEYLLAYAAQGRRDDSGTEARSMLEALYGALAEIGPQASAAFPHPAAVAGAGADDATAAGTSIAAYLAAVAEDARVARGAVGLVLSRSRIGSLLVDNLNASVHLRALLTDAFLLDQALDNS